MNRTSSTLTVIAGAVVLATTIAGVASAAPDAHPVPAGATTATSRGTTASPALTDLLRFSREEERMAKDLYAALAAVHDGAPPMSRITLSEDQHFAAVGTLLDSYGVADPSAGRAAGSYAFPELQSLYDGWLTKGSASLNAAYQVGIELEKRDIADLQKAVATTTQPDVKRVLGNLLNASRQHLSAYQSAASGESTGMGRGGFGAGTGLGAGQGMRPGSGNAGSGNVGPGKAGPGNVGPGKAGPARAGSGKAGPGNCAVTN